ncbi:DUF4410 domain-containing protein [Psittacicella gerlachiana]|uniref:DUF4410 domain-containing protein n=1 Tax=Psittacicella gerlachiana TaxID=2028574 RepID=A0A3A1Y8F4_9GAMM|nr:DUF4410 domain-containing protein [Psittacicella gerlachiana]RIY33510.1 hypothetical protein CKF59_06345 [Psittacicella gerlachiana]
MSQYKYFSLIIAIFCSFFLASCSVNTVMEKNPEATFDYRGFKVVNTSDLNDETIKEASIRFTQRLDKTLHQYFINEQEDVEVQVHVERYKPGSRLLRYLIGFGAGQAHLLAEVTIISKRQESYGRTDVTIVTSSRIFMGIFGGNAKSSIDRAVRQVVRDILKEKFFVRKTK